MSWDDLGPDARESQADLNRPLVRAAARPTRSPGFRSSHDALRRPGARIADLGCGGGWSSIALARAYPDATVDGVRRRRAVGRRWRRANAAAAGRRRPRDVPPGRRVRRDVGEGVRRGLRVRVRARPAGARRVPGHAPGAPPRPDGVTVVMDEAVAAEFTAPGDDLERMMYGFSLLVCLPDGMSQQPSRGTPQAAGTRVECAIQDYASRLGSIAWRGRRLRQTDGGGAAAVEDRRAFFRWSAPAAHTASARPARTPDQLRARRPRPGRGSRPAAAGSPWCRPAR